MNNHAQSVEINYLAESKFDEDILIRSSVENGAGSCFNHSLFRINYDKELCRIRIEWEKNNRN